MEPRHYLTSLLFMGLFRFTTKTETQNAAKRICQKRSFSQPKFVKTESRSVRKRSYDS